MITDVGPLLGTDAGVKPTLLKPEPPLIVTFDDLDDHEGLCPMDLRSAAKPEPSLILTLEDLDGLNDPREPRY